MTFFYSMNKIYLFVASIIRVCLIYYGTWHDRLIEVKFTDIDYEVFTEGAQHLVAGGSPYEKDTYKYTPLLAYIVAPNVLLHKLFAKVLFCTLDIAVALLMYRILKRMDTTKSTADKLIAVCWLFNPLTMTISARGNAESVQILLVLASIACLLETQNFASAVFFGLSVHFKLYSVIYVVPFILHIGSSRVKFTRHATKKEKLMAMLNILVNQSTVFYGAVSFATFILVGISMYSRFAWDFIYHTYLFHLERVDTQHNFSVYFYMLKLTQGTWLFQVLNRLAFLPQLLAVTYFGVVYSVQLPLACFLQTFAFVALNKVCTSQYFIWYIGLLPIALPYITLTKRNVLVIVTSWALGQAIWLFFAYLLEFRHMHLMEPLVWLASCLFLFVNLAIMRHLTRNVSYSETLVSSLGRTFISARKGL